MFPIYFETSKSKLKLLNNQDRLSCDYVSLYLKKGDYPENITAILDVNGVGLYEKKFQSQYILMDTEKVAYHTSDDNNNIIIFENLSIIDGQIFTLTLKNDDDKILSLDLKIIKGQVYFII